MPQISPGKIQHLNALSNNNGVIAAAAMDQRGSLRKSIANAKGVPQDQINDDMMAEFKVAVSKALTPHASAILLDPEFGLPAAKARSRNAGLLLAYEESGYDNTKPGRMPDLLPHLSAKRLKNEDADAVKILLYYSPSEEADRNDIKHAFIERVGSEAWERTSRSSWKLLFMIPKPAMRRALNSPRRSLIQSSSPWKNSANHSTTWTYSK